MKSEQILDNEWVAFVMRVIHRENKIPSLIVATNGEI